MASAVVDCLQTVNIEHHHGENRTLARAHGVVQLVAALEEGVPVARARERVRARCVDNAVHQAGQHENDKRAHPDRHEHHREGQLVAGGIELGIGHYQHEEHAVAQYVRRRDAELLSIHEGREHVVVLCSGNLLNRLGGKLELALPAEDEGAVAVHQGRKAAVEHRDAADFPAHGGKVEVEPHHADELAADVEGLRI